METSVMICCLNYMWWKWENSFFYWIIKNINKQVQQWLHFPVFLQPQNEEKNPAISTAYEKKVPV